MNTIQSEMKSRLHEINSRLDIAEEQISDHEDIIIETIKMKHKKKKN